MNTEVNFSLIDSALTEMAAKQNSSARLAELAQQQNHANPVTRMWLAFDRLREERVRLRADDKQNGTRYAKQMALKPEQFLSFVQLVMNKICWSARTLYFAKVEQAEQDALKSITGVDWSQAVNEQLNVEDAAEDPLESVSRIVDGDFVQLLNFHAFLGSKLDYLDDIDTLYLYADRANEDEVWTLKRSADTFEEALEVMSEISLEMAERERAAETEQALNMDWSTGLPA